MCQRKLLRKFNARLFRNMIKKLNIAVVSLSFRAEFNPLWQKHPHTDCCVIFQRNPEKLKEA